MMLISGQAPEAAVLNDLATWQGTIDQLTSFADRVAAAKKDFKSRNRKANKTFKAVRAALSTMCPGSRRCNYCEDSAADEVEHVAPKDFYPGRTFEFTNYLYACGPCNGPKNNQYAVRDTAGVEHEISSAPNAASVEPVAGDPLLIDPRSENPADFLALDLQATFFFTPAFGIDAFSTRRADWTITVLGLNSRDYLPEARRNAFNSFSAMLSQCASKRASNPQFDLTTLRQNLLASPHLTVFREMQRQAPVDASINLLFNNVAEALTW